MRWLRPELGLGTVRLLLLGVALGILGPRIRLTVVRESRTDDERQNLDSRSTICDGVDRVGEVVQVDPLEVLVGEVEVGR